MKRRRDESHHDCDKRLKGSMKSGHAIKRSYRPADNGARSLRIGHCRSRPGDSVGRFHDTSMTSKAPVKLHAWTDCRGIRFLKFCSRLCRAFHTSMIVVPVTPSRPFGGFVRNTTHRISKRLQAVHLRRTTRFPFCHSLWTLKSGSIDSTRTRR